MDQLIIESAGVSENGLSKNLEQMFSAFARRAAGNDRDNQFVKENYDELKQHRFFSALVPTELGGSGITHSEMCDILRLMAKACSSTALAASMHQHLVASALWKYKRGQGGEELLTKVAAVQLVLVSTGAGDWLSSNGEMVKVENGYHVSGIKHFASQSVTGDILVTSAVYNDPEKGRQAVHFPVPLAAPGVTILDNWDAMGMRGTGSNTVLLKDVFVPEGAIALKRQQGVYHPVFNVILTAAMPLIMSVYVGIAERAAEIALEEAMKKNEGATPYLAGEMKNELTVAQTLWKDMIRIANNLDFEPSNENGNEAAVRKTIVADACIKTVNKAMELAGGKAYLRPLGLERLFRDVQAAIYHPLQPKVQYLMTGEYLLRPINN